MRARLIAALKNGRIQSEMLNGCVDARDLLQSGQVSKEEVLEFLKLSRSVQYEETAHSFIPDIKTMIFRSHPTRGSFPVGWYVKCYCLPSEDEEIWFVSVYSTSERKTP